MREIRLSGSEGGGAEPNRSLLPLSMGGEEVPAGSGDEETFAERRASAPVIASNQQGESPCQGSLVPCNQR